MVSKGSISGLLKPWLHQQTLYMPNVWDCMQSSAFRFRHFDNSTEFVSQWFWIFHKSNLLVPGKKFLLSNVLGCFQMDRHCALAIDFKCKNKQCLLVRPGLHDAISPPLITWHNLTLHQSNFNQMFSLPCGKGSPRRSLHAVNSVLFDFREKHGQEEERQKRQQRVS